MQVSIADQQVKLNRVADALNISLDNLGFTQLAPNELGWMVVYSKPSALYDWVIRMSLDEKRDALNIDVNYLWKGGWLLSPNQKEKTTSALMFSGQWAIHSDLTTFKEEFLASLRAVILRKRL